jgi:penicillin-binding protein 2
MKEVNLTKNKYFLYFFIFVISVPLFVRLIDLQIVKGADFRHQANEYFIRYRPIYAPRGVIFSADGKQLVYNKATFSIWLDSTIIGDRKDEILNFISTAIEIPIEVLQKVYNEKVSVGYNEFILVDGLNWEKGPYQISLKEADLPGVRVESSTTRYYPEGDLYSHIIGYIGAVSKEDITKRGLDPNDTVGKDGLEAYYDGVLRGTNGRRVAEVTSVGKIINSYIPLEAIPGKNLYLTIDDRIQRKVWEVLNGAVKEGGASGGAAIIEDITNGGILAMVSVPAYDNNIFTGGLNYSKILEVMNDRNAPLLNRAISSAYPPGSTFKTVTGSVALESGSVNPYEKVYTGGVFDYRGVRFQDFGQRNWGYLNMVEAYKVSSNIYFMKCALSIDNKTGDGIGEIVKFAQLYGLGNKTGIDLPGETSGLLASPQTKMAIHNEMWYPGDLLNASIGQGDNLVSPIQMVVLASSIANNGVVLRPHVVGGIESNGFIRTVETEVVRSGFISQKNIEIIKKGMRATVSEPQGVARSINSPFVEVAAKTGSAEFGIKREGGYSSSHAWVMGFAPYDNPKIAFVFFLEGGGTSWNAAKHMRTILDWYFTEYRK